jgi:hypothetical protein
MAFVAMSASGSAAFTAYVVGLEPPRELPPPDAIIVLTNRQAQLDTAANHFKAGKGSAVAHPQRAFERRPDRAARSN